MDTGEPDVLCSRQGPKFSICAQADITSRSHAAVARHGMQLIPAQERGGAQRNDHHRTQGGSTTRLLPESEEHHGSTVFHGEIIEGSSISCFICCTETKCRRQAKLYRLMARYSSDRYETSNDIDPHPLHRYPSPRCHL
ncbi:hypothetical protein INR49_018635 [Caranx melampygus]|nr:hypothetical protein INR49_018635 [Caranx melampygus]